MPGKRGVRPCTTPRSGRTKRRCASGCAPLPSPSCSRSEEHTSELQSLAYLVCRLLLEKKKKQITKYFLPSKPTTSINSSPSINTPPLLILTAPASLTSITISMSTSSHHFALTCSSYSL